MRKAEFKRLKHKEAEATDFIHTPDRRIRIMVSRNRRKWAKRYVNRAPRRKGKQTKELEEYNPDIPRDQWEDLARYS